MATLVRLEDGTELILDKQGQDVAHLRKWFPHLRIHDVEEGWSGAPFKCEHDPAAIRGRRASGRRLRSVGDHLGRRK